MIAMPNILRNVLIVVGIAIVALLLFGCEYIDTGRQIASVEGAKVADKTLNDAIWVVCKGSSMGAVSRRFGVSQEATIAYTDFCNLRSGIPLPDE